MGRSGGAVENSRPRTDQVTGNKTARGEKNKSPKNCKHRLLST